jgi:molybdate transport system substrate-binding protein
MQQPDLKKITKIFLSLAVFLCLFSQNSFALPGRNLTVFAEQNMVAALVKIARLYSQKNHVIVSVNFNSSAELIGDVDSGEPADIFISAHSGWIETLRQKGLTDVYNTGHIARDKLVLVASKNNKKIPERLLNKRITLIEALQILNNNKAILITDQEGNSSGKYSTDLLKSLSLNDLQIFTKMAEDKSSVLDLTRDNSENYALLLASQLNNKPNLKILASQKKDNIFYQALVIAGDNMETAREFLKFLKSDYAAKVILRDNGFATD